jgi:hypothetical protein
MKKIRMVLSVLGIVLAGASAMATKVVMQNPVYEWIESEESCEPVFIDCDVTGTQACQLTSGGPVYRENTDIENQCGKALKRTP